MSSWNDVRKIAIVPNLPRDWVQTYQNAGNKKIDVFQEMGVVGLDIFVHNTGASSLTVTIDDRDPITVEAGDSFNWDNIKYAYVEITSSVNYDMVLAGIDLKQHR